MIDNARNRQLRQAGQLSGSPAHAGIDQHHTNDGRATYNRGASRKGRIGGHSLIANLPPYPAYKSSGVDWLGDVPAHWEQLPGRACYTEKKILNVGMQESTVLSLSYGRIVVRPPEKLRGLVP